MSRLLLLLDIPISFPSSRKNKETKTATVLSRLFPSVFTRSYKCPTVKLGLTRQGSKPYGPDSEPYGGAMYAKNPN
jgi:hypothetical protein